MNQFQGLIGIVFILGIAFFLSNNRKAINYKTVGIGLLLQFGLALFILKTDIGIRIFGWLGKAITKVLDFSSEGAKFVFGPLADVPFLAPIFQGRGFIFFFQIIPTIIFVAAIVNILYHIDLGRYILGTYTLIKNIIKKALGKPLSFNIVDTEVANTNLFRGSYAYEGHLGILPAVVQILADIMKKIMGVSGTEALSNISSAFVGQVEAQIMIKPYLKSMTMSELMASMTGSFACISGGVMAAYIGMGVPAQYLITASIMAAPGALVISKIMNPEVEESKTTGNVSLKVEKQFSNLVDAISAGCSDGLKIGLNVMAMLIGFLSLIALMDFFLGKFGGFLMNSCGLTPDMVFGWDLSTLNMNNILGFWFSGFAWAMGVPANEMMQGGALMGTKLVANEFVAYGNLSPMIKAGALSPKTVAIISFALCGFANFGSVGIQIGGISALEPSRRADIAKIAFRALIAGTLASYLSATLVGLLFKA
jgi:concentrative nucleoside transporter, CNT family